MVHHLVRVVVFTHHGLNAGDDDASVRRETEAAARGLDAGQRFRDVRLADAVPHARYVVGGEGGDIPEFLGGVGEVHRLQPEQAGGHQQRQAQAEFGQRHARPVGEDTPASRRPTRDRDHVSLHRRVAGACVCQG